MLLNYEELNEVLEVSAEQAVELQRLGAINEMGMWLVGEAEWILLAIGLDMTPGGYDVEVTLDETQVH